MASAVRELHYSCEYNRDPRLKALLLHLAGERVHDIYDTVAAETDKYADVKAKLTEYFSPKKNVQYEVYVFRKAAQQPGESLDAYNTRLRMLAKYCEFSDVDNEIKSQIIQSCTSSRVRKYGLREANKTLKELLEYGRTLEISELQSKGIEEGSNPITAVNQIHRKIHKKTYQKRPAGGSNTQCRNCGGEWPHKNECPARGKQCKACGKQNHFARQCRSKSQHTKQQAETQGYKKNYRKKINQVETHSESAQPKSSSSSDESYAYTVNSNSNSKQPLTQIKLYGDTVPVLIDSGAAVNIISEMTYNKLSVQPRLLHISEYSPMGPKTHCPS